MHSLVFLLLFSPAAQGEPTGVVRGQVVDARTRAPLAGVTVSIEGTERTAATDERGGFELAGVPVGSYNLLFHREGHGDILRPQIVVRSSRATVVNAELTASLWRGEETVVVDSASTSDAPGVTHALGAPELRRTAPADDLSRALLAIPGVVQVDDSANDVVVRGGSPIENGYFVDNIPIPNINHFPQEGATGGNISMLNLDFVDDVQVLTGGFGPAYGDRLSSIIDIHWREGDRKNLSGKVDLNMTGFGGGFEGPLPGGKGSWMVSARRSYLDLIGRYLDLGSLDSQFSDIQGKIVVDLGPRHRLTFLDIHGRSSGSRDEAGAVASGDSQGSDNTVQNTVGLDWRATWGTRAVSETSLSYAFVDNESTWQKQQSNEPPYRRDYFDGAVSLRNINRLQIATKHRLELGIEGAYRRGRAFERLTGEEVLLSRPSGAAFVAYAFTAGGLSGSLGLRVDRDPFNGRVHVAPRVSTSYAAGRRLTFSAAYGAYYQPLPFALVRQAPHNEELPSLESIHYVAGAAFRLRPDTRLSLEVYDKEYRDFPLSPQNPKRFIIDDVAGNEKSFWDYGVLVDGGRAYSRGVELMLDKKLMGRLYGVVSGSFFRTRYRDLEGAWRNRLYDNRFVVNVTGGYRPNKRWDLAARWLLAGGRGATPWKVWQWDGGGNANPDWDQWMNGHLPAYHTLGLRIDRHAYFRRASLSAYVAAWNLYDRKNVRYFYWNAERYELQAAYQWGMIPYFGVNLAF